MMIRTSIAAALALALAACGSGPDNATTPATAVKATPPPAGADWTTTVAATPEGGMRIGNPDAPIKLVEYGSLTCPACAAFSADSTEPLKKTYVATGKVSFEYRSLLLHAPDLMASLVLKCGGPAPFFALMEGSYADMQSWLGKLSAIPAAEMQRLQSLTPAAQNTEFARVSGLDQYAIQRGIPAAQLNQCLADTGKTEALMKTRTEAFEKYQVQGTPTFFINGKVVEGAANWRDLEPALKTAGA